MTSGPTPTPPADINVDVSLARRLVAEQHPELKSLDIRQGPSGWDNWHFRLGSNLCVRMPRRTLSSKLISNEIRLLPELSKGLPVSVPAPLYVGVPGCGYPWNWSITPWFEGTTAMASPITPAQQHVVAGQLGSFLSALHRVAPAEAPSNPFRGVPLETRDADVRSRSRQVAALIDVDRVLGTWDDLLTVPNYVGELVWVHGDLHPNNILLREHQLSAVLDFGDLCAGDPAVDFAIAWMMFGADARERLRGTSNVDTGTWQRARGWAVVFGLALVAHSADNPQYTQMGLKTLTNATTPGTHTDG